MPRFRRCGGPRGALESPLPTVRREVEGAEHGRKHDPHDHARLARRGRAVAVRLSPVTNLVGSYVTAQSALAYYGLIPEYVPVTTSVITARPGHWDTALGTYEFRHVKTSLLHGYHLVEVSTRQRAFLATPEKALLDLIYLQPAGDRMDYLRELRLQNQEPLDTSELQRQADLTASPKLRLVSAMAEEYRTL
jgi:predicted transcriptional regulator of viral defense system